MFEGVTKINKEVGLGNIRSHPPIDDSDPCKLNDYFKQEMEGPQMQNCSRT